LDRIQWQRQRLGSDPAVGYWIPADSTFSVDSSVLWPEFWEEIVILVAPYDAYKLPRKRNGIDMLILLVADKVQNLDILNQKKHASKGPSRRNANLDQSLMPHYFKKLTRKCFAPPPQSIRRLMFNWTLKTLAALFCCWRRRAKHGTLLGRIRRLSLRFLLFIFYFGVCLNIVIVANYADIICLFFRIYGSNSFHHSALVIRNL
jgi:hypothetical protein